MSTAKDRHYQQLAAKFQSLSQELADTQHHFSTLAKQLNAMNDLGAMHAAQFMAISRLLDEEMVQKMDAAETQSQSTEPGTTQ
ncbi:hypothetical protein FRC02_004301 [Tulasnella sp. 418]|nr:hypothetical protein FRC02_004301 [Tulasnella sp. 418]